MKQLQSEACAQHQGSWVNMTQWALLSGPPFTTEDDYQTKKWRREFSCSHVMFMFLPDLDPSNAFPVCLE